MSQVPGVVHTRPSIVLGTVALAALACARAPIRVPTPTPAAGECLVALAAPTDNELIVVARVIDGDTVRLETGETVRLIGVDTPETKHPQKPVERFGREASGFTTRVVQGKRVRLEYDQQRQDKYGRTLAYVFLEDGTFANAEIIRQGYGYAYTRFPFKYLEQFRCLERKAREGGRGLWRAAEAAEIVPALAAGPWPCPPDKPIKGNATGSECVYHVPGAPYYTRTQPEKCFATEADASAAGCRRSGCKASEQRGRNRDASTDGGGTCIGNPGRLFRS